LHLKHHNNEAISVRWLTVSGLSVRVAVKEGPGHRRPLLVFNGIGASFEMLRPFVDAMQDKELILFDAPGAGKSAAPLVPWRLRHYASAAAEILDALGHAEADVIGLSWGGALAQQFAKQFPGRCSRLVLAATSPGHIMVPAKPGILMHMMNPRRYADRNYMRKIAGTIYGGSFRTNRIAAKRYTDSTTTPSTRGYYYQLLAISGWSSLPWLHRLAQPTLVIQGSDDPLIPRSNGKILAALIPNARLVEVDCGHLFMLTRAREVAVALEDFLHGADT